jgi:hypothetical protein
MYMHTISSVVFKSRNGASSSAATTPPLEEIYCPICKYVPEQNNIHKLPL